MAEKTASLSIVIRTVDQATAKLKAINERIDEVTKPVRDFKKQLGELAEKSGLSAVSEGFKGVGEAVKETLFKFVEAAAVVGELTHLVLELVDQYDELGKKAERLGVGVDFLAQTRAAAERAGASVEGLDQGLQSFSENLGQARAGTGRMAKFLNTVSPALERQLVAAKSNAEAFDLLADAMAKVQDPAKRAALAQKTVGDPTLAPLLHLGSKGIQELRDQYLKQAGSQEEATKAATETHEAMLDLKGATDGVKASLVEGLAPALTIIIKQLTEWLQGHREGIKEWIADLGKKLPGAVSVLVASIKSVLGHVLGFVDAIGGWKVAAAALAAVMAGPLLSAVVTLGIALLTTPVGWILAGMAALGVAGYELAKHWDAVAGFFVDMWDTIKAKFGWAADAIAYLLAPFIYIPAKIIGNWGAIKDFFSTLWDGVTEVFQKAWAVIEAIVDKVVGAVDFVKDKISSLNPFNNPFEGHTAAGDLEAMFAAWRNPFGGDVSGQSRDAFGAFMGAANGQAKITVDFANAPRGTRVKTDPQSTADVDLSVGYQMLGLTP